MGLFEGDVPETLASYGQAKMVSMPTMAQRLDLAVQQAEKKLADAKEARDIFNRNPDLERLLNIMQNNHF